MRKGRTNHAASVRALLLNRFQETGGKFDFLLRRFAGERFLYRLGESPHRDDFVLKGAALFVLWGGSLYRPTRDLDFAGFGPSEVETIRETVRRICAVSLPEDGLEFDLEPLSVTPIRGGDEYDGYRVEFTARLENARIPMRVDVGFGDRIEPGAREVEYPTVLDLPAPRIRAYPKESVVAEKLHAMVVQDSRNTRYKDFYDLQVMAAHLDFDGESLATAIRATFERRNTRIRSGVLCLTPGFYADGSRGERWRTYLTRNDLPGAPADFAAVGESIRRFLNDLWNALTAGESFGGLWAAGWPWPEDDRREGVGDV